MFLAFIFVLIKLAAAGQLCMNCQNVINPHECNLVTKCGDHEQCYMEQYLRHNIIWYDLGCQSNTVCNAINGLNGPPVPVIGRRQLTVKESAPNSYDFEVEDDGRIPICESCCNSTAACNNGGACGVSAFDYHNGRLCFKCDQQLSPDNCDQVTLCDQDRFCYIHQKISDIGLIRIYESGCSRTIENCTQTIGNICSNCCQGNLCNNQCAIKQYPPITTTTTTTRKTTTLRPTTTTPTTTTTTTTTTTPKPTTPVPRPPVIVSTEVQPANYHYGDNVHILCKVESNPPHDNLGWNMMTDPQNIPSNLHLEYGTNSVKININHLTRENIGQYQCFVHNSVGQDLEVFQLTEPQ